MLSLSKKSTQLTMSCDFAFSRFIIALHPRTPKPEHLVEEVAKLLRQPIKHIAVLICQIKETKVLVGIPSLQG